jgi:hypothetical protein
MERIDPVEEKERTTMKSLSQIAKEVLACMSDVPQPVADIAEDVFLRPLFSEVTPDPKMPAPGCFGGSESVLYRTQVRQAIREIREACKKATGDPDSVQVEHHQSEATLSDKGKKIVRPEPMGFFLSREAFAWARITLAA